MPPNKRGLPANYCFFTALNVYLQVCGGVWGRGDARRPGQPVRDGGVGVVQPEVVLCPRETSGEVDGVADITRLESCVGSWRACRGPENNI